MLATIVKLNQVLG